ncbi:retrovirus-related pol polyprotein from transposon TNT 1-94 [Tanacetum coccineum]
MKDLGQLSLKELRCSTQVSHADVDVVISGVVVLLILLMEYRPTEYEVEKDTSQSKQKSSKFFDDIIHKTLIYTNESPKIVTSKNVVFNESVMYKDTLKDSGVGDKSVEELQEDRDDEDAGDQETNQPPDLTEYQLVRDREPRTRTKPLRFRDESNMAAYAFIATEEEDTDEPLIYQEAVACEDSSKWKATMEEEMDSLRKNKT